MASSLVGALAVRARTWLVMTKALEAAWKLAGLWLSPSLSRAAWATGRLSASVTFVSMADTAS